MTTHAHGIMNDAQTTVAQLRERIRRFVAERDWNQFHTPKNLAMSLAIEAAELMEHFQWLTPEQSAALGEDPARREAVGEEMADVLAYLLALANQLDLDLAAVFEVKMTKNERKYPAEQFRGLFGHADPNRPG
jgi:NTP pyrophosphatase (non-canonical NTP hydrolase)